MTTAAITMSTVSYTHLDVYKRQELTLEKLFKEMEGEMAYEQN